MTLLTCIIFCRNILTTGKFVFHTYGEINPCKIYKFNREGKFTHGKFELDILPNLGNVIATIFHPFWWIFSPSGSYIEGIPSIIWVHFRQFQLYIILAKYLPSAGFLSPSRGTAPSAAVREKKNGSAYGTLCFERLRRLVGATFGGGKKIKRKNVWRLRRLIA